MLRTYQLHRKREMENLETSPYHSRGAMGSLRMHLCHHRTVMKSRKIMGTSRAYLSRHRRKGHNGWHLRVNEVIRSHLVFGKADEIESRHSSHTDVLEGQNHSSWPTCGP